MTCTACERAGTKDCSKTFQCSVCHSEYDICGYMVGGFDAVERVCAACHLYRATGLKVTKSGRTRKAQPRRSCEVCNDIAS